MGADGWVSETERARRLRSEFTLSAFLSRQAVRLDEQLKRSWRAAGGPQRRTGVPFEVLEETIDHVASPQHRLLPLPLVHLRHPVQYPAAQKLHLKPLHETALVYQGHVRMTREIPVDAGPANRLGTGQTTINKD